MLVGLTGGIAAGKSAVAAMLRELGAEVLDADQLARQVLDRDPALRQELARALGPRVLAADGSLDRQRLGRLVFGDAAARRKLEAITHPVIAAEAGRRVAELRRRGARVIVYEAALLVETGRHRELDALLVVTADDELRVQRLMQRNGLSEQEARQRLASQLSQQDKAREAHYVVDNSGALEDTRRRVLQVWAAILRRLEGE